MQKTDTRYHCRNYDPERWFPLGTGPQAQLDTDFAVSVCNLCPARAACLDWALATGVEFGIWGGMTEQERRATRRHTVYGRSNRAIHPTHADALV